MLNTHVASVYGAIEMIYGEIISEVQQVIGAFTADKVRGAAVGLKPGKIGIQFDRVFRVASDNDSALVFNRYRVDVRRMKE